MCWSVQLGSSQLDSGLQGGLQGSAAKIVILKLFSPVLLSLASLVGKEFENSALEASELIGKLTIFFHLSVLFWILLGVLLFKWPLIRHFWREKDNRRLYKEAWAVIVPMHLIPQLWVLWVASKRNYNVLSVLGGTYLCLESFWGLRPQACW